MVKFLDDKDGQEGLMTDIQVHTRKNYVTSLQGSNILADILVWIMMEDLDNVSIDELDTIETRQLDEGDIQIKRLTTLPVCHGE